MKKFKIKRLEIINFRNIKNKILTFNDGANIITGKNGTGKSNILDAISFMFSEEVKKI